MAEGWEAASEVWFDGVVVMSGGVVVMSEGWGGVGGACVLPVSPPSPRALASLCLTPVHRRA